MKNLTTEQIEQKATEYAEGLYLATQIQRDLVKLGYMRACNDWNRSLLEAEKEGEKP